MSPNALIANWLRKRRGYLLSRQLPEFLQLVHSGLTAGHTLSSSLQIAAQHSAPPLGREFQRIMTRQRSGLDLVRQLQELGRQAPHHMMQLTLTALIVTLESGCGAKQMVEEVEKLCSAQQAIVQQLVAKTVQARLQALVSSLLPLFMATALQLIDPNYLSPLYSDRGGYLACATALLLNIAGFIWIHHLCQCERPFS